MLFSCIIIIYISGLLLLLFLTLTILQTVTNLVNYQIRLFVLIVFVRQNFLCLWYIHKFLIGALNQEVYQCGR